MKKKILFLVVVCSLFFIPIYRQHLSPKKFSKTRVALGTLIEITLLSKSDQTDKVIDTCFQIIDELGKKLNYQDPKSQISFVNRQTKAPIFPELYQLLRFSQEVYLLSGKKFDPSIGALIDIWDFHKKKVPTPLQITTAQNNSGLTKVVFDSLTISKPKRLKIHLGGVGKGFIVQKVYQYLQRKGVESGYINAGGDILLFGQKSKKIGITHPRQRDALIDTIFLKNGAVVTSGDYERFFIADGKRYHHIIDPISGYPSTNCISVSVVDSTILRADALATAFFLMPVEQAITVANQEDVALLIYFIEGQELQSRESIKFNQYRASKR